MVDFALLKLKSKQARTTAMSAYVNLAREISNMRTAIHVKVLEEGMIAAGWIELDGSTRKDDIARVVSFRGHRCCSRLL